MQFCPLLLNVGVESLPLKKSKEGQDLCALPLNPELQYRKFLGSRDFEYSKVSLGFLAIHKY